jgi:predicted TIM-barrel fold metal-dependent hydrolase
MIVDSHIHAIAADETRYHLKTGPKSAWLRRMPAEEILAQLNAAGIDRAILVQAFGAYGFDNSYAVDSAEAWPDRFASVCTVDPWAEDAPNQLSRWVTERGAVGLRLHVPAAGMALDDPRLGRLVERAGALAIPVCMLTQYAAIAQLGGLLEHHPTVPIALDHMSFPPLDQGPPYVSAQGLFDLARFPNLLVKFSSLNLHAVVAAGGSVRDFLRHAVDHFGASRLMWGSNFPASAECPLSEQLAFARDSLGFLSAGDQRLILGTTASQLWPARLPTRFTHINRSA